MRHHRVMNAGLQQFLLEAAIARAGYDPDLFDVCSWIDDRLSYPENYDIVMRQLRPSLRAVAAMLEA